eukprot:tig00021589_g22724.t1
MGCGSSTPAAAPVAPEGGGAAAAPKPAVGTSAADPGPVTAAPKHGWLCKGSAFNEKKRQWWSLHDHRLWYSKSEAEKPEGDIALAGCSKVVGTKDNAFEVIYANGSKETFAAASEADQKAWVEAIYNATHYGNINDKYEVKDQIGSGGFSEVRIGKEKATGIEWAIKIISRKTFTQNKKDLLTEIAIMRAVRHANIVHLNEVIESRESLHFVLEYMRGGDLVTRILERGSQSEKDAASAVKQVLAAVAYLHETGIVHRDLKLENCVYSNNENTSLIKLIDFGLSKFDGRSEPGPYRLVGTPEYMAPEILRQKGYDKPVDMWACGVLTYILLSGCYPFSGDTNEATFREILRARVDFPDSEWAHVSEGAKSLIRRLLEADPAKRLTAKQAQQDPWITGNAPDTPLPQTNIDNLRRYLARRRLKKAVHGVMAVNILNMLQLQHHGGSKADMNANASARLAGASTPVLAAAAAAAADGKTGDVQAPSDE